MNAANAKSYMGGWLGKHVRLPGVTESIHYATAGAVEREAKRVVRKHPPGVGDVYITDAYNPSCEVGRPRGHDVEARFTIEPRDCRAVQGERGRCVSNAGTSYSRNTTARNRYNDESTLGTWRSYINGRSVCRIWRST